MSYAIETLNSGRAEEFGFLGPDVWRVRLGELAPMKLSQFCAYSAVVLAVSLEGIDPQIREEIAQIVRSAISKVENQKVRPELDFDKVSVPKTGEEFFSELEKAKAKGDEERIAQLGDVLIANCFEKPKDYPTNPFAIRESHILIGSRYEIDLREFAHFTTYVLTGGFFGWDELGIPKEANLALERLAEAVELMTPGKLAETSKPC